MDNAGTIKSSPSGSPSDDTVNRPRRAASSWRKRVTIGFLVIALIAAAVVLPPLINVGRYQRQVTTLVSRSLGRPVELSSVGLRLLPRPGFILHDLSVAEDPNFGAEPVLAARTVIASIGIASLWKGRLALDRVSVDEASLNLVQTPEGRWNLESLMMGAQPSLAQGAPSSAETTSGKAPAFPYLEATNSRVNLKRGTEKTPFSIVNTDLSLWQENPGQWRVRLRGQPVRTDIEMSWADTGEVRLEANLHSAAQLREMPFKLQMEWRDAHLGQLSRLILGSDAGWRGDLTADIDVQGTADAAQTKARLRVTGVRREEFAPETPLDLDTNCSFQYQHSQNALRNIGCDSALGNGSLHLKAELPGKDGPPRAMLDVKQVPLQAALDLLRTVRSGFAPGISAQGVANGNLVYQPAVTTPALKPAVVLNTRQHSNTKPSKLDQSIPQHPAGDLEGSLIVTGITLKGGQFKEPMALPEITWTPTQLPATGLETRFTIRLPAPAPPPAAQSGAAKPVVDNQDSAEASPKSGVVKASSHEPSPALAVHLNVAAGGYDAQVTGSAAMANLRALAYALGLPHNDSLDSFVAGNTTLNLSAKGPWVAPLLPAETSTPETTHQAASSPSALLQPPALNSSGDAIQGTLQMQRSQWKPAYLPRAVDLQQATVTINGASASWIAGFTSGFSYTASPETAAVPRDPAVAPAPATLPAATTSPAPAIPLDRPTPALQGTIDVQPPVTCEGNDCHPRIHLKFGALDAALVQAALLGTPAQKSLLSPLSPLIDRVRNEIGSNGNPVWPVTTLYLEADSLLMGPTLLRKPQAELLIRSYGDIEIKSWSAEMLGGAANGSGSFELTDGKPQYALDGSFANLNPSAVGTLIANRCTGSAASAIHGTAKLKLQGLDWKELEASATGDVQFNWPGGTMQASAPQPVHFESWNGALTLGDGKAQLAKNEMILGKRSTAITGIIPFGSPAKLVVADPGDQAAVTSATPALPKSAH